MRPTGAALCAVESYDPVARAIHWFVAALAVIVVALRWAIAGAPRDTPSRDLLLLHRSVGLMILATMVFRVGWRWRHPAPPLPASVGPWERAVAGSSHLSFYAMLIVMPLLGYVNAAAAGHAVSFFGLVSIPALPRENDRLSQYAIAAHLVGQYALYLLLALHITGALRHGILNRDGVLDRMLPPRVPPP